MSRADAYDGYFHESRARLLLALGALEPDVRKLVIW
jgi:hypothetical protein